jgi:hypothetical protein
MQVQTSRAVRRCIALWKNEYSETTISKGLHFDMASSTVAALGTATMEALPTFFDNRPCR